MPAPRALIVLLTNVLIGLSPMSRAGAPPSSDGARPAGMSVHLRDGSVLLGEAAGGSFPVITWATVPPALASMRSVVFPAEGGRDCTVNFVNGDRISGLAEFEALALDTRLGRLRIPVAEMKRVEVFPLAEGPRRGLAGWWAFDGDFGDGHLGARRHPAVNRGALPVTDRFGAARKAIRFDGYGQRVTVADHDDLDMDAAFTLGMWIKAESHACLKYPKEYSMLISKWNTSPGHGDYILDMTTDGRLRLRVGRSDGGWKAAAVIGESEIPLSRWTHVAATFDRGQMRVYVNGILDGEEVSEAVPYTDRAEYTRDHISFGGHHNGHYGYAGEMDDVRVYWRSLEPAEIADWYRATRGPAGRAGVSM